MDRENMAKHVKHSGVSRVRPLPPRHQAQAIARLSRTSSLRANRDAMSAVYAQVMEDLGRCKSELRLHQKCTPTPGEVAAIDEILNILREIATESDGIIQGRRLGEG